MKTNMKHYFLNWECDTPQDDPYAEHDGWYHVRAINHEKAYKWCIKELKSRKAINPRVTHIEELEQIFATTKFMEVK